MYTVCFFDEFACDDVAIFEGTLEQCITFVDGDDELYIVEPDGFTVYA